MNIERYDVVYGIVTDERKSSVEVKAEGIDALCVCKDAVLRKGDKALFTVVSYCIDTHGVMLSLSCDSVIEYGNAA